LPARRFPPWPVEESDACFAVKDNVEPMWSISDNKTSLQKETAIAYEKV
jgi:hypothetical protein